MAEHPRKKASGKQPISRHPLFPLAVSGWFAALFGLSGLAIQPALLERIVLAADLPSLIPAAAPPLGMTAQALVALALAGVGGLAGALLARRLVRDASGAAARKRGASAVTQPEDGEASPLERMVGQGGIDEHESVDPDGHDHLVPEDKIGPAQSRPILNVAEFGFDSFDAAGSEEGGEARSDRSSVVHDETSDVPDVRAAEPAKPGFTLFQRFVETPPASKGGSAADAGTPAFLAAGKGDECRPDPAGSEIEEAVSAEHRTAAERIATADLNELSHVELLERLAMTMERHRRAVAAVSTALESLPVEPTVAEDTGRIDETPRLDSGVSAPETIPAALRPVGIGHDEDEPLPGFVPPRRIGMPRSLSTRGDGADTVGMTPDQERTEADPDQDERALEQGYSSLLDLSRPRQSDTGADGDDDRQGVANTEQALRSALATLQRMSGTA